MLAVPLVGMGAHALPEGCGKFAAACLRPCAVAERAPHAIFYQQSSLVAERDGVAAARLADNAGGGCIATDHSARPTRSRRLLFDRADHKQGALQWLSFTGKAGGGAQEGGQRPLRVHRTAPIEASVFDTHGDGAAHRVHMSEQNDRLCLRVSVRRYTGHEVSGLINMRVQSHCPRLFDQKARQRCFLPGITGNGQHAVQQGDFRVGKGFVGCGCENSFDCGMREGRRQARTPTNPVCAVVFQYLFDGFDDMR